MNKSRFTAQMTGQLVRISQPEPDWAFVPAELPVAWEFPVSLWPLLVDAKAKLGTLNGIGRTLPNPQLLLRPLQDREMLRSSSLEGTHASIEQVLLFEERPREPRSVSDPSNAWREVFNYGAALREGLRLLAERPLSTVLIQSMHEKLMSGVRGRGSAPSRLRQHQVHVGSDRRYVPPPAPLLPDLMGNLQEYMNRGDDFDPLVRSFITHLQFEAIHPFVDGNGRVGRALLALMIARTHEHHMPWLYMSAYFERYKDEYIGKMFDVSANGAWTDWIEFCLRGTVAQAEDSIRRCDLLKKIERQYQERANIARPRIASILQRLFTKPVLTIPEIKRSLNVSYKTAQCDVEHLVESNVLKRLPDTNHPKVFYAPEITRIAWVDNLDEEDAAHPTSDDGFEGQDNGTQSATRQPTRQPV